MRTAVSLILLVTLASAFSNLFVATPMAYACDSCNFVLAWGSKGSGPGQSYNPSGVAVDSAGNVYVTDPGNNRVQKFTSDGRHIAQWGSYGSGPGQFNQLRGIAIDSSGNVYVADYGNNRVEKFGSLTVN